MRREHWVLPSLATGPMNVLAYGHAGLPVVFIGAEQASGLDLRAGRACSTPSRG